MNTPTLGVIVAEGYPVARITLADLLASDVPLIDSFNMLGEHPPEAQPAIIAGLQKHSCIFRIPKKSANVFNDLMER